MRVEDRKSLADVWWAQLQWDLNHVRTAQWRGGFAHSRPLPFDPVVHDGSPWGPSDPFERARWRYVTGQVDLEAYERSIETWLRWEDGGS